MFQSSVFRSSPTINHDEVQPYRITKKVRYLIHSQYSALPQSLHLQVCSLRSTPHCSRDTKKLLTKYASTGTESRSSSDGNVWAVEFAITSCLLSLILKT